MPNIGSNSSSLVTGSLIVLLIGVVLLLGTGAVAGSAHSANVTIGDVDEDGEVTINDAVSIQRFVLGLDPGTTFNQTAADVDRDGDIAIDDAVAAQRISLGLADSELRVSNLTAPEQIPAGDTVVVTAEIENAGSVGAITNIEFRIAAAGTDLGENTTVAEQTVDLAPNGDSQTVTFELSTESLTAGEFTHGVFAGTDSSTAGLSVAPVNGSITGAVTDDQRGNPIANVTIRAESEDGTVFEATTGADGTYRLNVPAGPYVVKPAETPDRFSTEAVVTVAAGEEVVQNFTLTGEDPFITGLVQNEQTGNTIDGAIVFDGDGTAFSVETGSDGRFIINDSEFEVGETIVLRANADGFVESNLEFVTLAYGANEVNFGLNPQEQVETVQLDSVSSLLNENEQPLTDDSIVAVAAEPSATNSDEDGNGDAVSYPSETDIPVVTVDDTVVGVTGPFVTTDTDFSNYGNEEVMLNIYDELLDGSGTIVHDEGHGQFYTLSPNGGDDYQAFADYARENGYEYQATDNLTAELDTADAVVITSPSEAFTQTELDSLAAFANDGGVVVLHDQSDFGDLDETDNHNEIAAAVGAEFRFNDDQVIDSENNTGAQFVPVTGNFNTETFAGLFTERNGLGLDLDVNESYEVEIIDVTDGDTVDVRFNDSTQTIDTVRIVGIDTPETSASNERPEEYEGIDSVDTLVDLGGAATAYAERQLAGKTVTLSFDANEGLRGNFGRLLGFLELPDGSIYNEKVIEDGFARVYDSGFNDHDKYWELEADARANDRGIWNESNQTATPELRDSSVEELFFPDPVAVTGSTTPVLSENGDPLVALDRDANVAAIGGPLIEESFEAAEGGPGTEQFGVYPFLTNVITAVGNATGPVIVDDGHGQFGSDFAVSTEDTAYYLRYLEGQSTETERFIDLEGVVDLASDPGPNLLDDTGNPAARAVIISAPTSELTASERAAVTDFADAGGAVILLGTAADISTNENFEPLLNDLDADVGFTTTPVTDPDNNLNGDPSVPTTTNFDRTNFAELFTPFTPPVNFTVTDLAPQKLTVAETEEFDTSATITNSDTSTAEQPIELRLNPDGPAIVTQQVQLTPGETTTIQFENISVSTSGQYNYTIASPTNQATGELIVEPTVDTIVLDRVSSLLNENRQPLRNDSVIAVQAEPSATNVDVDENNDTVRYPDDTEIPVVAVENNVVGITGPFVQEDDFIDYADFGNDEFLLNLYDNLLGGSGTIIHDESHGQFYDVASIQSFANTVRNNGYTYAATTNLTADLNSADAVVITTPSEAFTQAELDALTAFVDSGGVVFLHDQSDNNNFDATENHNDIATALNVSFRFNDDQVEDTENNNGVPFSPTTENFNLQQFRSLFTDRADTTESSVSRNRALRLVRSENQYVSFATD